MAAFADLTINDGQATPVAHTFKARRITPEGVARYQDISSGIAIGFPTIEVSNREPLKNSPNYRVKVKAILPVLETISGNTHAGIVAAPQKAYDLIADMEFILPARSTLAVRKDLLAYVKNCLAHATMTSVLQDLDFVS